MARRIVVAATLDKSIAWEFDLDTWPAVPRVGDKVEWTSDDKRYEAVVDEVMWRLTHDEGSFDGVVWVGTTDTREVAE